MLRPTLACIVLLAVQLAATAGASHLPCPPEDCPAAVPIPDVPYVKGDVHLDEARATVRILDDYAATALQLTLSNPAPEARQAEVTFPYPYGASLVAFNLSVDGRVLEARVEERAAAQRSYDDAVEGGRSAALLRVADERRVALSVNVPAGTTRVVAAEYREWVDIAAGTRAYRLPLSQLPKDVGSVALDVRVSGAVERLQATDTPLDFEESGGSHIAVTALPRAARDLVLTWSTPGGWSAHAYATAAEGAGFGAVELCLGDAPALGRDVVFVLDRSGSMGGEKITAARDALAAGLATITPADRYDVVTFDDQVEAFHDAMVDAARTADDRTRLGRVMVGGGTDIDAGLQRALEVLGGEDSERLPMLVFITDGLPSAGITDHDRIIERFVAHNDRHATVHVVPIGLDADRTFLADLALRSGGVFLPLDPHDGALGLRLGRALDRVGRPVLSDLTITVAGVEARQPLPANLGALYEDQCAHVGFIGTFGAPVQVDVDALGPDGPVHKSFTIQPEEVRIDRGVAALWGHDRVAELLSRERNGELVRAEVVETAVALRQLSPYTSWVVTEDQEDVALPDLAEVAQNASTGFASSAGSHARDAAPGEDLRVRVDVAPAGANGGNAAPGAGLWAIVVLVVATATTRRRTP